MRALPRSLVLLLATPLAAGCALIREAEIAALFGSEGGTGPDTPADTAPGTPEDSAAPTDADGDGSPAAEDCDDDDATRYPGAPEWLDDLDHDCDGQPLPAPSALVLPAASGTLGPVRLAAGTRDGEPVAVLAWTALRCTPPAEDDLACLGRRTWQPASTTAEAAEDDLLGLGGPNDGAVLDFAYREYGAAMGAVLATRVEDKTTVSNLGLTGNAITESWDAGDESPLPALLDAQAVEVDLQIVELDERPYLQTVLCSDTAPLRGGQLYAGFVSELGRDRWDEADVSACAVSALGARTVQWSLGIGTEVRLALSTDLSTGPVSDMETWGTVGSPVDLASSPYAEPVVDGPPGTPRADAYASTEGVSVVFANADGDRRGENHALTGGLTAVGVDVDREAGVVSSAWLCLVSPDGTAALARAAHPDAGGGLSRVPVPLDAPATSCSVAVVPGRHLVAAFDTASAPFLVEVDLPPRQGEEEAD